MSSLATSSPVSASTFEYLIRWPVFRFSWLKETFSDSDVAGYSATGQVTRERRRKPFQLARGAMRKNSVSGRHGLKTNKGDRFRHPFSALRRPRRARGEIAIHAATALTNWNKNRTIMDDA